MNSKKGKSRKRSTYGKRVLLASITALFLGAAAVGTSLAFLIDRTGTITNTFTGSEITGTIDETFDGETKTNVAIKNTGDVDAYIRVALVPSWVNDDGEVYGIASKEETGYSLTLSGEGWQRGDDGFYYCTEKVAAGSSTPVLVEECKPLVSKQDSAGNELHFELHVIASLIQAEPDQAVKDAWGDAAYDMVTGGNSAGADTN